MPCYDSRDSYESRSRELQDKCNRLTRLLCEVLTQNENIVASRDLQSWWTAHQVLDRQRAERAQEQKELAKQRERERQERLDTIKSLTPEQRRILNL